MDTDSEQGAPSTRWTEMQEELRASGLLFRGVFEGTPVGINLTDVEGHVLATNPAFAQMLGCDESELRAKTIDAITHPDDRAGDRTLFTELLSGARDHYRIEKRYVRPDGTIVWVRLSVSLIRDASGTPQFTVGVAEDITERKAMEEALRESERRFSSAFEHSPIGMALVGLDGRWLKVNRALCTLLGYTEEQLLGATFQDLTHPDDLKEDLVFVQQLLAGEVMQRVREKRYFHRDGHTVWVRVSVSLVTHEDGTPWYCVTQTEDISEQKRTQEALHALLRQQAASLEAIEYRAAHDLLTGLPNRSLAIDRLHHAVLSARRRNATCGLLLLDLDGFKAVNDAYGHAAGDACLVEVARRLESVLRRGDTVARLGGDEFVIVLPDANDMGAKLVADKLQLVLDTPIELESGAVRVGASVGAALYPMHGEDAQSLIHHADMAMYAGKRRARRSSVKSAAG